MVLTLIRSKLQGIMSNIQSSPSISLSSSAKLSKNEVGGWKWEVNHDGVVWSWYHTYPSPTVLDRNPPSNSSNSSKMDENKSIQVTDVDNRSKRSLVDYWYLVHDGVVIPTINDN
jgi:hypothetical protein